MDALFKEIMDGVRSTVRDLRVYLLGRGLVTTAAIAAGVIGSATAGGLTAATLAPAIPVLLIGGTLLSGYMRLREMRFNQDRMADIYREEIADQLGIPAGEVTRAHVHTLAFGDAKRGIPSNPILREEIDREWNKTWLKFATTALAGMASFGLISFWSATEVVASTLPTLLGPTLGSIVGLGSVGIVTGFTGLFLNNGLDFGVQRATSLGATTLHDRIAKLDRDIGRGKQVGKEQVFGLFVAADKLLAHNIELRFGKPYDMLPLPMKAQVVASVGAADQMQAIAGDLNAKRISAGTVAFIITGQHAVPNPAQVQIKQPSSTPAQTVQQEKVKPRFAERELARREAVNAEVVR